MSNFNQFYWHPLTKYIEQVMSIYHNNEANVGKIDKFTDILDTLRTKYPDKKDVQDLCDIFVPLDINQKNSLVLFKYKNFVALSDLGYNFADFWMRHNKLYRECRSVVFDIQNHEICLAPQPKFFNVNENEEWMEAQIRKKIDNAQAVEITDKMDGSNQNYRWYHGEIVGSGAQAIDERNAEAWRLADGYTMIHKPEYEKMLKAYPDWTFCFEYISSKDLHVVQYAPEKQGLYLFGCRNAYTGEQKRYDEVIKIGKEYGVLTTCIFNTSFDEIMSQLDDYKASDKEGWVIGIIDGHGEIFKAKLKINDFLNMHRVLAKHMSPNAIIEAICEQTYDDLYSRIPEGFRPEMRRIAEQVWEYEHKERKLVNEYIELVKQAVPCSADVMERIIEYTKAEIPTAEYDQEVKEQLKAYALWINEHVPKQLCGYVLNELKGKSVCFLKSGQRYKKLNELI